MSRGNRLVAAAAMTGWALASGPVEGGEPTRIVLHLTNHAGVDGQRLAQAQTRAQSVFSDVGVRLVWMGPVVEMDDQACSDLHLSVTLLSTDREVGTRNAGPNSQILGIADRTGGTAFVYPVRIEALAERTRRRAGELLGLVIAHEVGHLLLAPGHSQVGIMARSVETDPAQTWALFSSGQSRSIRALLARKARECGDRVALRR